MFLIACTLYNNSIHSATNLKPREIFYGIRDNEERPLDREKMLEVRNKIYDEAIHQISQTQQKQNAQRNLNRADPPTLEPDQLAFVKRQGVKSKRQDFFNPVVVAENRQQTFLDEDNRRLHKGKIRRIRK